MEVGRKAQKIIATLVVAGTIFLGTGTAQANSCCFPDPDQVNAVTGGASVTGTFYWTSPTVGSGTLYVKDTAADGYNAYGSWRVRYEDGTYSAWQGPAQSSGGNGWKTTGGNGTFVPIYVNLATSKNIYQLQVQTWNFSGGYHYANYNISPGGS